MNYFKKIVGLLIVSHLVSCSEKEPEIEYLWDDEIEYLWDETTILFPLNNGSNNEIEAILTVDKNKSDGKGDRLKNGPVFTGFYNSGHNINSTLVFELTGITDTSEITFANFSARQEIVGEPNMAVELHVVRAGKKGAIQVSDHHKSVLKLATNYEGDGTVGMVSLDSIGQAELGAWLQDNYREGKFVFIGLKSNKIVSNGNGHHGFSYSNIKLEITMQETILERQ